MSPPFELSVILAEAQENPDIFAPLRAVERACVGIRTEVVVVRPPDGKALPASETLTVREVIVAPMTLVPERWGRGVQAASAPVFACLTTELIVHETWARRLLKALAAGAVGASGSIALASRASSVATAVYLVRFNAFLPRPGAGPRPAHNIPGDSAAYRRDAVERFPALLAVGFWEADFHRCFNAEGSQLAYFDEPLSSFGSALSLRSAMRIRARHAFGFGVTRVHSHGEPAVRVLLASPLVPFVLISRIFRRAASAAFPWPVAMRSIPALAALCAAWALGEGAGAWRAWRQP